MLLQQAGKLKIGEVARYTLIYTPSEDEIVPTPHVLHVKIRNTSAIPLRAAYLHGPYTFYAACYPKTFDPHEKDGDLEQHGAPQFESQVKAGGSWDAQLRVPDRIRQEAGKVNARRTTDGKVPSVTWIFDIASQILFSTSAAVQYELSVGHNAKALEVGYTEMLGLPPSTPPVAPPGQLLDHQQSRRRRDGQSTQQQAGIFSRAIALMVDDTTSLWHKPSLPAWEDEGKNRGRMRGHVGAANEGKIRSGIDANDGSNSGGTDAGGSDTDGTNFAGKDTQIKRLKKPHEIPRYNLRKRKKVHLVILTHGLHGNLGADMLYLKESIDAAAKKARLEARARKARAYPQGRSTSSPDLNDQLASEVKVANGAPAPLSGGRDEVPDNDDPDDEEVIVRGFPGNAVRTEKGIQYLGKRLAKWVLTMTYPDQPYLPIKKSMTRSISRALSGHELAQANPGAPSHHHSIIHQRKSDTDGLAYQITSISFLGHSLGGLIQTYAIAYIHKHSPLFFTRIQPVNFISLATPFLGLSNENPIYVKFALDSGLVGRTGKDLGLAWRAPTMVRNGWGAMIAGIGTEGQRASRQQDPGQKPLLRVLPTGPAHQALAMFRNRTVYSNVVNDGIVPLRTSCLLFLDWSGLGKVEKARRENGLVGTMAGWGWAELAGINSGARSGRQIFGRLHSGQHSADEDSPTRSRPKSSGTVVPQPDDGAINEDADMGRELLPGRGTSPHGREQRLGIDDQANNPTKITFQPSSPLTGLFNLFKPASPRSDVQLPTGGTIYRRSQALNPDEDTHGQGNSPFSNSSDDRPTLARGDNALEDPNNLFTPPRTTFFESAGDILNPPIPLRNFLIDPTSRPRTIFHDRVYHPGDIPPVPLRKRGSSLRGSASSEEHRSKDEKETPSSIPLEPSASSPPSGSAMKVEEKIARAYHHELSWRKVLVRLEPDAHNNIIVRRMFSNAYGWPVVKHLVDTHFADAFPVITKDAETPGIERARPVGESVGEHGEEVRDQFNDPNFSETQEMRDEVPELTSPTEHPQQIRSRFPSFLRHDSSTWDDKFFDGTDDEADDQDILDNISMKRPWFGNDSRAASVSSHIAGGDEDAPVLEQIHGIGEHEETLPFYIPPSPNVPIIAASSSTKLTDLGLQNAPKPDG